MSKGNQNVRFQVAPVALVSLAMASTRYNSFKLINYPSGACYPLGSYQLKSMSQWDNSSAIASSPSDTLLYRLLHAMLVGTNSEDGATQLMRFDPHTYCKPWMPFKEFFEPQQCILYRFQHQGKRKR